MKKTKEYNKCFAWIENRITTMGPQSLSDLMWESGNTDIERHLISYIINYDGFFSFDENNNVCVYSKISTSDFKPFSCGALKF